ncbi:MAG: thiamine-phosphate pyrophosphorylase [Dehalococcoidia bacterium]|nr:thiamine-phosphate pyrophosphorylase [Dehalococcoidia bacterium]
MVPTALGNNRPLLCLVTDRTLVPEGSLAGRVMRAVAGGVDMVQLREKDLPVEALVTLAKVLRVACGNSVLLMINGNPEVARMAGADGVHLPEDGPSIASIRSVAGSRVIIGRSVHSLEAAVHGEAEGADYLIVGTIFESQSKPGKDPEGLVLLEAVTQAVRIPVLGIGGINAVNAHQVVAAGASGVAVISAILGALDAERAARELVSGLSTNAHPLRVPLRTMGPGLSSRQMITLTINGKRESLDGPTQLADFLSSRLDPKRMVAIGYNGQVVHRQEWPNVTLAEGDVIDIVHMVGGGC